MLAAGVGTLVPTLHGETVTMLSGPDAGRTYTAVIEIVPDLTLDPSSLGMDRRAKRKISFFSAAPKVNGKTKIQDSGGNRFTVIDDPQNSYLATEFELQEIVSGIDQT